MTRILHHCLAWLRATVARRRSRQVLFDVLSDTILRVRADGTCLDAQLAPDFLQQYPDVSSSFDLLGRTVSELLPRNASSHLLEAVRHAIDTRQMRIVKFAHAPDQTEFYFEARIFGSGSDEALILLRNVTEQHRAEEILHQQANLVENADDAIIYTDLNFGLRNWNRAAERVYGRKLKDVQGQPFNEIVQIRYPEDNRAASIAQFYKTGHWRGEQIHHHRDGTPIYMLASVAFVLDARGNPTGVVGINRDITEQKRAESLMMLAQKFESLSLLAGGIAHDFNNLLTSILNQIALAQQKLPKDHASAGHLTKAIKSTERAADLTRQLLAYTGQGAFVIEAVDLNRLIQDNLGLLEAVLSKQTRLELRLEHNLPTIKIDRGQIQQITMNLVINAAESITHDHGYVAIETTALEMEADQLSQYISANPIPPGRYVSLKVSDNGSGIAANTLERIFDPYFTTKESGSGLGLSATLGIVNRYHGGIRVESPQAPSAGYGYSTNQPVQHQPEATEEEPETVDSPGGTIFTLIFPASQQADSLNDAPLASTRPQSIDGTVLVVDDEAPVREAVEDILIAIGTHVITARDGSEGIEKFAAHQKEIALVLLDLQMPVMNGTDALRQIRAIDPDVKIILSSGYSESESTKSLLHNELTLFLQKPYAPEKLIRLIHSALNA